MPNTAEQLGQIARQLEEGIEQAVRLASSATVAAPALYDVLASLKLLALPRLFEVFAAGLERSLTEMDVREDDGGDPAVSVAAAVVHLADAHAAAVAMREALEAAQSAIAKQSARPRSL